MITKITFWCQKVLPVEFDDSLSYYETLCKVVDKLNEVVDNTNKAFNQLETDVNAELNKKQDTLVSGENIKTINGQSILGSGNAEIDTGVKSISAGGIALATDENGNVDVPAASSTTLGVMKTSVNGGTYMNSDRSVWIYPASNDEISRRDDKRKPIIPLNLDYAIKASMCDGKGAAWTETEQKAACVRAGAVYDGKFELIEEIACDGKATAYTRTVDVNGNPYNLLSVYIEFEIESGHSYTSAVFFRAYDAESNTVLYDGSLVNQRNYVTYLFGGVDAKNGMYQGWMISGNIASYDSGGSGIKRINRHAPIISPIKKIYIMVGGDLKFLSGDKIRIYGVRA